MEYVGAGLNSVMVSSRIKTVKSLYNELSIARTYSVGCDFLEGKRGAKKLFPIIHSFSLTFPIFPPLPALQLSVPSFLVEDGGETSYH